MPCAGPRRFVLPVLPILPSSVSNSGNDSSGADVNGEPEVENVAEDEEVSMSMSALARSCHQGRKVWLPLVASLDKTCGRFRV